MDRSEHWKHLLHRLNCVKEDLISSPPGFSLTLDFADNASKFNFASEKVQDGVSLYIDGVFFRMESGASHTYLPIDQLVSVMLTAVPA